MSRKKIAVIGVRGIPSTYGGIEKHCEELYPFITENGFDVDLYARSYYCKEAISTYKGINIVTIPIINISGFDTFIYSFISTIIATFSNADIIHFHAQGPALFSFIPRILAPKKMLCFTCHGIDKDRDKWGRIGKFVITLGEIASAKFPHCKIGVSEHLKEYYESKYNAEMHKIYNGVSLYEPLEINISKRFGIQANDYFIFVGRLVPEKAPDILIKAFRKVNTDKKLLIVGGSAGTDDYVSQLKELAAGDERIIFTSYVYGEELRELYSNAFAYASASKLEGLPLTLLEAMSFGIPAVLSNISPHMEVMNQGYNIGISFQDSATEACRSALEQMLSLDENNILELKNASKQMVKDIFDWKKIAFQTMDTFNNIYDNFKNTNSKFKG